jgi:hypothetical protein
MQQVAIVIPVYRENCHDWEKFALERCAHILDRYPVIFFGPKSMKYKYYLDIVKNAQVVRFDDRFFSSIPSYSDLLLSKPFYESFLDYEYILIHQLDAFVFEDQLVNWCEKKYDYIGAPWFKDYGHDMEGGLVGVGNGGLCLRNIRKCLDVLNSRKSGFTRENSIKKILKNAEKMIKYKKYTHVEKCIQEYVKNGVGEDLFWGRDAVRFCSNFNIIPIEEAVYFSFETGLKYLKDKYTNKLPFGCHASWNVKMIYSFSKGNLPESEYEYHLHEVIKHIF